MVKLILFTFQPCCTEYLYSNLVAIEQDCLIFVLNAKLTAGQIALCNGNLSADLLRISRPGKFQPTGSSYHADESIQLQKTEPLRLHYSSFQRLWHLQLVTSGFMASTRSEQHLPCILQSSSESARLRSSLQTSLSVIPFRDRPFEGFPRSYPNCLYPKEKQ